MKNNDKRSNNRPKLEWIVVAEFRDAANEACVQITAAQTRDRTMYSMRTGRVVERDGEEDVVSHFPYRTEGQGQVRLEKRWALALVPLLEEADEWMRERIQLDEDERIARMQQRESKKFDRPAVVQPGGAIR